MNLSFYKMNRVYLYLLFVLSGLFIAPVKTFATNYYQQDFETGLGGFVLDNVSGLGHGLWHRTDQAIAYQPGHSATHILYYGLDDPCNYNLIDPVDGPLAHQGRAISPIIDLTTASAPLFLEFHYYLETENDTDYDLATVDISANGETFELLTGQRAGLIDPCSRWQKCVLNLSSWAGSNIKLRFGFNTVTIQNNNFIGFALDDFYIHDGADPVNFEDANLKAAVETELVIPNPTAADMMNLTYLQATFKGITSLVGIEYAHNLQFIDFWQNPISDLSPLANLTNLQSIYMASNQIGNLIPLTGLKILKALYLNNNQIISLAPVAGLYNLEELDLYKTQIVDITPLTNLINLEYLWLGFNQINNISSLSDLTKLQYLSLYKNQITDISPLDKLVNLRVLYLSYNRIDDISPLADLTKMQRLDLDDVNISDLIPLAGMTEMQRLNVSRNPIDNHTPLTGMTKLQELGLWYNQISDISFLSGLTNLSYLRLDNNQFSNLSPIAGLTNLQDLRLNYNLINDLSPLTQLNKLQKLFLTGNYLNTPTYCHWISVIQTNNPGISISLYTPNPNILTNDCSINLPEYALFASQWLDQPCLHTNSWCNHADLDHNGVVDLLDVAILVDLWLR